MGRMVLVVAAVVQGQVVTAAVVAPITEVAPAVAVVLVGALEPVVRRERAVVRPLV